MSTDISEEMIRIAERRFSKDDYKMIEGNRAIVKAEELRPLGE